MPHIAGLDPISLNHPATSRLARAFVKADAALREGFALSGGKGPVSGHFAREAAYYAAMKALHEAEDAVPGEERRGMGDRSVFDEIGARGLKAEGGYVLCAYRPTDYRRVPGPHIFASYLTFATLAEAIDYAETRIIGPEIGFLPWAINGDARMPGLVTDVWLRIDADDSRTSHRRINLSGQRWKVLEPVGSIGIQCEAAHREHIADRMAEMALARTA